MDEILYKAAETMKRLPVEIRSFEEADAWVGCVVAVQKAAATMSRLCIKHPEEEEQNGE